MKICDRCQKELPLTEYWKQARKPDGLQQYCKQCMKIYQKAYRTRNKEREFIPYVENKLCGSCGRQLPTVCFYRDTSRKDGLKSLCKECQDVRAQSYKKQIAFFADCS